MILHVAWIVLHAIVHSMHLGLKISGVELAFFELGLYSLAYWRNKCKSRRAVLVIFTPQVYANCQRWRTLEELLAYLQREVYTECTLACMVSEFRSVLVIL